MDLLKRKNIYLTGFMGTGKTSSGKILAQNLRWRFVDLDFLITQKEKKEIKEIFASQGEKYFRQIETELLKTVSLNSKQVISCGGGIVIKQTNRLIMHSTGIVVCLSASPRIIYQRLCQDRTRPLLQVKDPLKRIEELIAQREEFYREADLFINTDNYSPEQVARIIFDKIKNEGWFSETRS